MEHFRYHRTPVAVKGGYTLVELLVVLAIIVLISVVTIVSQSSFNKTLILSNTAYDVALTLRSAQTYGIGSRAAGIIENTGYGLHFERSTPDTFTLFADTYPGPSTTSCHPIPPGFDASVPTALPGNCVYDASQGEQVVTYALGNGITIQDFCTQAGGSWTCASGSLSSLDIVFARPNPDPFVSVNGTYSLGYPVSKSCLTFTSRHGGARYISVSASGEITANATSCP